MDGGAGGASNRTRPVVLYPSPGMGHLVSMIELGKALGARGLAVTIVVIDSPHNTGATGPSLAGVSTANPCISFHVLPKVERIPAIASKHQEAFPFEVVRLSDPHLRGFLAAAPPAVLVVDFFCSIALGAARDLGVPAYFFFTSGAKVLAFFLHLPVLHVATPASFGEMGDELVHVPGIPPFPATHAILPPIMESGDAAYHGFLNVCHDLCRSQGVIVNTFRSLEARAVNAVVAGRCTPPGAPVVSVHCIGPLIKSDEVGGAGGEECLAWLDTQPEGSVVFLCFGSIGRFSVDQIREVAAGSGSCGWSPPRPATTRRGSSRSRRSRTWTRSSRRASLPAPGTGASSSSRGRRSGTCWRTRPWAASSRTAAGTRCWRR